MKLVYILLGVTIILSSCITESCPPDETIGEMLISEESKSILPYENVIGLIFEDGNSNQIILESPNGLIDSFWVNCVFKPCTVALVDETCENVEMESRKIDFENDIIRISIRMLWRTSYDNDTEIDTNFIETIETSFYRNNEFSSTNFISNSRGKELSVDFLDANKADTLINYQLIDSTYKEIFVKNDNVWFVKSKGLVGFKLEENIYELKQIKM